MTTPSGPGRPHDGPPLEPVRVLRPRRTDALAELFRECEEAGRGGYEQVPSPRPPHGSEERTQELPPVAAARRTSGIRRTALVLAVAAAAAAGFGGALLFMEGDADGRAAPGPRPSTTAPVTPAPPAPAEQGFLREGDSGPEVTELQERLLRVPDVYRSGATDGRYDAALSAAVARFQLWYGVRGDETGVYGDDTRLALESRTGRPGG
ncbi:peptidoglycan-binding domain-containing protein [Streptomyces sp. NPDC000931]